MKRSILRLPAFAGFLIAVVILAGCTSTVTPTIVQPAQASYSGKERNSGVISRIPDGYVVDGNFRARYNALIDIYGAEYHLQHDAGIMRVWPDPAHPENERWLIDFEHMDLMVRMSIKHHSGILPK